MTRKKQAGFTLMETMVALVVLLAVSAVVMSGMMQMMKTQGTITNRTAMHTSVRSATELLQQEIGQAGKIYPQPQGAVWTMNTLIPAGPSPDKPITFNGVTFTAFDTSVPPNPILFFEGEWVTVDTGLNRETIQLQCPAGPGACPPSAVAAWQATFVWNHAAGVPISVQGSFSGGIVPPAIPALPGALRTIPAGYTGYPLFPAGPPAYPFPDSPAQGSTGNVLKLFGDLNGDGNMVYVEYTCVQGTLLAPGFLYRNQVPWTSTVMPPNDPSMIVLTGVLTNPNDANGNAVPCFTYQLKTTGGANSAANDLAFVTDVAVTLTVQTQIPDPQEPNVNGQPNYQRETKALLNISPRNVYDAWQSGNLGYTNRIQPMPLNLKGQILPNYQ